MRVLRTLAFGLVASAAIVCAMTGAVVIGLALANLK